MHELSICRKIMSQVNDIAHLNQAPTIDNQYLIEPDGNQLHSHEFQEQV